MHSGYPINTHMDIVDVETGAIQLNITKLELEGSWGHYHEVGHNMQREPWTFHGTDEVTCK